MSALPSPFDFDGAQLLCTAPPLRPRAPAGRETEERELSTLMRAAQCGDRAAYVQLVRKIMPLLQRVLRTRHGFLQAADRLLKRCPAAMRDRSHSRQRRESRNLAGEATQRSGRRAPSPPA